MKTKTFLYSFSRAMLVTAVLTLLIYLMPACRHDSNFEDDTFKQATTDDEARANRKAAEREHKDSVAHADSIRNMQAH